MDSMIRDGVEVKTLTKPIGEVIAHIRSPFMNMRNHLLDWLVVAVVEKDRRQTIRSFIMRRWKEFDRDLVEIIHEEFGRLVEACSSSEEKS